MKKLLIFLTIFMISSNLLAQSRKETAKESALGLAKVTFNYLGDNLDLQIFSATEFADKVYLQIAIGTSRRPARMTSCFVATFKNNGFDYISNLKQLWGEPCEPQNR